MPSKPSEEEVVIPEVMPERARQEPTIPPVLAELLTFADGIYRVYLIEREDGDYASHRPPEVIVRAKWERKH